MTHIEKRLTTIANALETHSELLAERRNIANASVSIGKAAEELRKLAKQHSEQIADMSDLCLTTEEANELKAQAGRDGFIECYFALRKVQHGDVFDLVMAADEYANRLRQQAKGGEK